jgi:hypothetical protein
MGYILYNINNKLSLDSKCNLPHSKPLKNKYYFQWRNKKKTAYLWGNRRMPITKSKDEINRETLT